jgi:TolB-like protein/class 3 adenylate cyclase/tetratricopeptide (TPR) repeat protein
MAMERRLSAILAADVVGYTRLMEVDEAGTFARLRAHRQEIFEPEIAKHHGRIFKLMGDGLLAEFTSVVDAVECAVALQRGMVERNKDVPAEQRIDVRIGINLGDVIVEDDDRHGEGVNIAARLQALAEPGGICVSRTVVNHVKNKLNISFEDLGEHRVKNIAEPVSVYRISGEATAGRRSGGQAARQRALRRWGSAAAAIVLVLFGAGFTWVVLQDQHSAPALALPDKPSIAVLPFNNMSHDSEWDLAADGMTENIITDLARVGELFVIARNSTFVYKGKSVDARQVGRELGVHYVLEGSIQASKDKLRVTAQLIDAATGRHVWSDVYDRPTNDIFSLQDEVAQEIAGRLSGWEGVVSDQFRTVAHQKAPANLKAFDYYLLGIEAKHKFTKEHNIEAQQYFKKAIELDPGLARAYTGLAWTYNLEIDLAYTPSSAKSMEGWFANALKAVELDPEDSDARVVLAIAYLYDNQYSRAEAEIERAFVLNSNNADALLLYGYYGAWLGKPELALERAEKAVRLNPNFPLWYYYGLRNAYFYARKFEKALEVANQITDPVTHDLAYLAAIHAELGHQDEAKKITQQLLKIDQYWSGERYISDSGRFARDEELNLYLDAIRAAGLPACTPEIKIQEDTSVKRLPFCEQERART